MDHVNLLNLDMSVYVVKFNDGSTYAARAQESPVNPDEMLAGGPVVFLDAGMAQIYANAVKGSVEARVLSDAVDRCNKHGYSLYIRKYSGETAVVLECSVPYDPETAADVKPVLGKYRLSLLKAYQETRFGGVNGRS
jgi:hypothetical protein